MIKIGVFGAGHLGKIHIKLIQELKDTFELVGFYDPSDENAKMAIEQYGVERYSNLEDLMEKVDAVDIVTPTLSHFDVASKAIKSSKHVFIEKPVTETLDEAKILLNLCEEADVKVQVGHVERFNPAFLKASETIHNPMFIETHRLAQFNPRGCDVPVVLDLMIHDIDIILSVVNSNIRRISASGVAIVSDTPDICNARIEFDNGCVANLTSSRISLKNMRKSRFFQKDAYISVDFLTKELEVVKMKDLEGEPDPFDMVLELGEGKPSKLIMFDKPEIDELNAIKEELRTFAESIATNSPTRVSLHDGYSALKVATDILEKLQVNISLAQSIS